MVFGLYLMAIAMIYAVELDSMLLVMIAGVGYLIAEIRYSHLKDRIEKLEKEKKNDQNRKL